MKGRTERSRKTQKLKQVRFFDSRLSFHAMRCPRLLSKAEALQPHVVYDCAREIATKAWKFHFSCITVVLHPPITFREEV